MKKRFQIFAILLIGSVNVYSQKTDTVIINPSNINTKALIPGTHCYLEYFKFGKDSSRTRYHFWTRKIDFIIHEGRESVSISQECENNDTVVYKSLSICERSTFSPLYLESWFRGFPSRTHDFIKKEAKADGRLLTSADTAKTDKRNYDGFQTALSQYFLDWHLDLEVFSTLPYKEGATFLINYYSPGFAAHEKVAYTVKGSEKLKMSSGEEIDCWILYHEQSATNTEKFWINKKTKEVMKLVAGFKVGFQNRFRYKIKLPFSV